MDSLIAAAARALNSGDAIGALKHVGHREDPPALALRGIAMAQLGVHARARELLRRAARAFGPQERRSRARCVVAEAEIALAMRDLGRPQHALAAATEVLGRLGDHHNAWLARLIAARRSLLLGELATTGRILSGRDPVNRSPSLTVVEELIRAELALRSLRMSEARQCLDLAQAAAERAGIPSLLAETAAAREHLERPAARLIARGREQLLQLDAVAELYGSGALIVDTCRRGVQMGHVWVPLARRPVLFTLAHALAAAAPAAAARQLLIERAFRIRRADATHRARLRVELSRLRKVLAGIARIESTAAGFILQASDCRPVMLLEPPIAGAAASLLALLADGAAWSTSALALATGVSQRTVQRSLAELEAEGQVRSILRARAQRWRAAPLAEFTTILLLPAVTPLA